MDNDHYQADLPQSIGQKIDDCTDTQNNFPQREESLPRLAAHLPPTRWHRFSIHPLSFGLIMMKNIEKKRTKV